MSSKDSFTPDSGPVCVFGGGNGWGKRVAETMRTAGFDVIIVEKDASNADIRQAISASALLFVAIPDPAINSLLQDHGKAMHGRMLIDCATNKSGFSKRLQELASEGVSICSSHPMAVSSAALRGQNVLLMPIGSNAVAAENAAHRIYDLLGMRIARIDFVQHGEIMALVQLLPHLVQRVFIDALATGLAAQNLQIADLTTLASANYLLAELGLGRVAAQRGEVSAGIIATGVAGEFGRTLLTALRESLETIQKTSDSRSGLAALFDAATQQIDPEGGWRKDMAVKSEAALIRLGNLRSRSLAIEAPNRIGMLRDILTVLARNGIDMTALDSQLITDADGSERVRFEIGISNSHLPQESIRRELESIGVCLHNNDTIEKQGHSFP
jgi:prephenate dehydrogenase